MKNNLIVRALQEAQDIFGVDFDFDEFGYGEEDEFEEEDEVSLIPESAQIECTCPGKWEVIKISLHEYKTKESEKW